MSDGEAQRHEAALEREGWTRRFTAIGSRLREAAELYRGLGFEIRLAPADSSSEAVADPSACAQCLVTTLAQTIYTRPRAIQAGEHLTEVAEVAEREHDEQLPRQRS